jgi:hypothetical protein
MRVHRTFAAIAGVLMFGAWARAQEAATLPPDADRVMPGGQPMMMNEDATDSDVAAEEFALTLQPSDAAARRRGRRYSSSRAANTSSMPASTLPAILT